VLNIIYHPDIEKEIKSSYQWYESKTKGLGEDFLSELESAFKTIAELPDAWPVVKMGFRRFLLRRFPFGVIYRKKSDKIFVVAVMHLSRKPGYWGKRIE